MQDKLDFKVSRQWEEREYQIAHGCSGNIAKEKVTEGQGIAKREGAAPFDSGTTNPSSNTLAGATDAANIPAATLTWPQLEAKIGSVASMTGAQFSKARSAIAASADHRPGHLLRGPTQPCTLGSTGAFLLPRLSAPSASHQASLSASDANSEDHPAEEDFAVAAPADAASAYATILAALDITFADNSPEPKVYTTSGEHGDATAHLDAVKGNAALLAVNANIASQSLGEALPHPTQPSAVPHLAVQAPASKPPMQVAQHSEPAAANPFEKTAISHKNHL
ncbi:hypothetical protein L7F22_004497 [Adiantum nelumboides]|nr:hypothetical protein [Adiantum nelumboides]